VQLRQLRLLAKDVGGGVMITDQAAKAEGALEERELHAQPLQLPLKVLWHPGQQVGTPL
jgi:hypothetical protein